MVEQVRGRRQVGWETSSAEVKCAGEVSRMVGRRRLNPMESGARVSITENSWLLSSFTFNGFPLVATVAIEILRLIGANAGACPLPNKKGFEAGCGMPVLEEAAFAEGRGSFETGRGSIDDRPRMVGRAVAFARAAGVIAGFAELDDAVEAVRPALEAAAEAEPFGLLLALPERTPVLLSPLNAFSFDDPVIGPALELDEASRSRRIGEDGWKTEEDKDFCGETRPMEDAVPLR